MRLFSFAATLALICLACCSKASFDGLNSPATPVLDKAFSNNGRTDVVQWDNYSLVVNDQRIFLYSGEFHAFRLPVPDLWLDIFQKMKAMGLNGVSIYLHWGLSHPAPGVLDFDDWRDLQSLFDAAKHAGIFIVIRPGPYINAETTAGGIAHWVTSQVAGELRTNASDFEATWVPYIKAVAKAVIPNQITNGGPIIAVQIDNEYAQNPAPRAEYFAQLEAAFISAGVVVPLSYNDPGMGSNFINGTGAVDLYGLDSYPQLFDCSHPETWNPVTLNYHQYHERVNPSEPWYFPEFQGGSFDAWGPTSPGYDQCFTLTGPDFQQVFYLQLWASNAKLISYYMMHGGTSWGAIPFHGVYTSYDYGATIRENRELSTKFMELKNQGMFIRSSPDFRKTDWIGDTSTGAVNVSNTAAFVTFLSNPDTKAGFYIARQEDSTSTALITFKVHISTSSGSFNVPQSTSGMVLDGRQSRLIVTDYSFGKSSSVLYSTASVFFAGVIGARDVLVLHGPSTQSHEVVMALAGNSGIRTKSQDVTFSAAPSKRTTITILPGLNGLVTVFESSTQLVLYADSTTIGAFFAPVIPTSKPSNFTSYWQFGSNETVLVGGPYLVRNASIDGSVLALQGDLNQSVTLTVVAPPSVETVSWNGATLSQARSQSNGFTTFNLQRASSAASTHVPSLQNWKFADSLPEIQSNFSDETWIIANHTTTNIPDKPFYGDGRILYGCDYGFCENTVIFRGHFTGTGSEKSANLSVNGGEAFATSVWINDVFIKTAFGNSSNNANILEEIDDVFDFPEGSVNVGEDNLITIIYDNMGLNETQNLNADTSKCPRGVRGFKLNNGTFGVWKVQGKLGGYTNYPDKVRGIFNEGGTFGERSGWHLPGFDTSEWETRALSAGLPGDAAGVGFFVTTFDLNVPTGLDVPMSFVFDNNTFGPAYRAYLFINGWFMGKRVANLGPQSKFPVHQGILDYNGTNTVAVALWSMEAGTNIKPTLQLVQDGNFEGGVGEIAVNNPQWSPRTLPN